MGKKALKKDLRMEIRKNRGRFLSIVLIVALGVAFFSGLRSTESDMRATADAFADSSHMMDLRIIGSMGLTDADVEALRAIAGASDAEGSKMKHVLTQRNDTEYVVELTQVPERINQLQVTEGRMPETVTECLADNRLKKIGYQLGDVISVYESTGKETSSAAADLVSALQDSGDGSLKSGLTQTEFTIVGFGDSPQYIGIERGSAAIGSGQVNGFAAVLPEVFEQTYYTQIFVTSEQAEKEIAFTDGYTEAADRLRQSAEALEEERCQARYEELKKITRDNLGYFLTWMSQLEQPTWTIYDRDDLPGYTDFGSNAERMGAIGTVFPAVFFLVAALVALTAITRMVEEQRTQIGTYKALGYSRADVLFRYLAYALAATVSGGVIGVLCGEKIFPFVIIICYRIMYSPLRHLVIPYNLTYAVMSVALAAVSTSVATLAACLKETAAAPAVLMRPAAPKAGKRVWLEYLTPLWKRLSFSQKAALRNLFRYKKRLVMTVFGIGCCCGLMVVGFGLKDSIMNIASIQYDNIQLYDAMVSVNTDRSADEVQALEEKLDQDERVSAQAEVMMKSVDASTDQAIRTVYLVAAKNPADLEQMIVFRDRGTKEHWELEDGSVIVSEQLAGALGIKEGDSFTLKSGDTLSARPVTAHIAENYLMHYVYMTENTYQSCFGEAPEYNMYWLNLTDSGKAQEELLGKELIAMDGVLTVTYVSATRDMIEQMLQSLYLIVIVLVAAASMLAFVVIYNLNNINISERRRELATIKLLGFYDMEAAAYIYRENVYLTIIGALAGLGIGKLLHAFVITTIEVNQVMFGRTISASSYVTCVVLTIVFAIAVNAVMYFQVKKIDMVESLKSVE